MDSKNTKEPYLVRRITSSKFGNSSPIKNNFASCKFLNEIDYIECFDSYDLETNDEEDTVQSPNSLAVKGIFINSEKYKTICPQIRINKLQLNKNYLQLEADSSSDINFDMQNKNDNNIPEFISDSKNDIINNNNNYQIIDTKTDSIGFKYLQKLMDENPTNFTKSSNLILTTKRSKKKQNCKCLF